jgi:hypothetical protein
MTREEALQEARRRWGPRAIVRDMKRYPELGPRFNVFRTGEQVGPEGEGETWEEAFADADRRAGGAK